MSMLSPMPRVPASRVESTEENPKIVKEVMAFISDDMKHDRFHVYECERLMHEHYKERGIKFKKVC